MTESLAEWIATADALRHLEHFETETIPLGVGFIRERSDDYYTSLVGDLFDRMHDDAAGGTEWARLGNAFFQFVEDQGGLLTRNGIDQAEAALYSAAAFYCGGFPASAYLSMVRMNPVPTDGVTRACYDLLARPGQPVSEAVRGLLQALRTGDAAYIVRMSELAQVESARALADGPEAWVPTRLYQHLLRRFSLVNLRAVLPARAAGFWDAFVDSLVSRTPSTWEFFPSQIQAIQGNLLSDGPSYTLQMPTGAGKTTLSETLLFDHLQRRPTEAAVLLVPYRSLASELRRSLVKHLNGLNISARCAYGGTVPSSDEVHDLQQTRLIVATPEALSGILGVDQDFLRRISLVICDEGHLLGAPSRGVGLELLLARLKAREAGQPRFVFISAIVPNVEEINAWLGGNAGTVIRSDYRPASAEFAVLRARQDHQETVVDLEVHPHLAEPPRFTVERFLSRREFRYFNVPTNRWRTYSFDSFKTKAVAAARKSLTMGTAVIFAANKRGNQGAIGLAEELVEQLRSPLTLPQPITYATAQKVGDAVDYVRREYGNGWIGTQALAVGAVLHHGDIPQETREALERLLNEKHVRLAICTSTLAEGVNLPIRTLVLYSVRRGNSSGGVDTLLARDIKNLVGRAGRAGSTTKGLVICANADQWPDIERVASEQPGEDMVGALRTLVQRLYQFLAINNRILTNHDLDDTPDLFDLIDGIDSTLIDLAAEEITSERLVEIASALADQTFASQQVGEPSRELLRQVFRLRASRVAEIIAAGQISWIRETGAKARMIATVGADLLPAYAGWDGVADPIDGVFLDIVLRWAWQHGGLGHSIRKAYRVDDTANLEAIRPNFFILVQRWLAGDTFSQIAIATGTDVNEILGILTGAVSYSLQTVVEQAISLLGKMLESQGRTPSAATLSLPSCLRFGVPSIAASALASAGIRHRRAAILLASDPQVQLALGVPRNILLAIIHNVLTTNEVAWRAALGTLVLENTLADAS
jgi:helicase